MALFSIAIGMETNNIKSTINTSGFSPHETQYTLHRFPFTLHPLDDGFRYLGYILKPHCYKITNWIWLVATIERRLNIWHHKHLSRDGHLVLLNAVLEATHLYCMSLTWIPRGILTRIQNIYCRFLWKGKHAGRIFAWTRWEILALPKKWGGWGIKSLCHFSTTLVAKLGWQLITSCSLWKRVAYSKCKYPLNLMDMIRHPTWNWTSISVIWKSVLNSMPLIRDEITWKIHFGSLVRIGRDPLDR